MRQVPIFRRALGKPRLQRRFEHRAPSWTLRSATGCRTAHSEHTIAITEDGAEILTAPGFNQLQMPPGAKTSSTSSSNQPISRATSNTV